MSKITILKTDNGYIVSTVSTLGYKVETVFLIKKEAYDYAEKLMYAGIRQRSKMYN
jgi:hypothetical protein